MAATMLKNRMMVNDLVKLPPWRMKTVWISDLHWGAINSATDKFVATLDRIRCERLYLVGDIVDFWKLSKAWFPRWPSAANEVFDAIQRKVDEGTEVFLFRGNHDDEFRSLLGREIGVGDVLDLIIRSLGDKARRFERRHSAAIEKFVNCRTGIKVADTLIHETQTGLRLLTLHGDQLDGPLQAKFSKCLARIGDILYSQLLFINRWVNKGGSLLGLPYMPISKVAKRCVKLADQFIGGFEELVAAEANRRNCYGIVSGHIHWAEMRWIDKVLYLNCGDFVEGHTLLVEDADGNLWLLHSSHKNGKLRAWSYFDAMSGAIRKPEAVEDFVLPGPENESMQDLVSANEN